MTVAILKYPAGNIFSVQAAIKRLGGESIVTDDKETLKKSDKIIIPGQGEAASTMAYLRRYGMDEFIREFQQPVLHEHISANKGEEIHTCKQGKNSSNGMEFYNKPTKPFI